MGERYQPILAALAALLVSIIVAYRMRGFFPDDALITLRFARNLARGDGWTYNVGSSTAEGATSPAYTAIVALLATPLRGETHAAGALFLASFAAIAGFLVATFNRLSAPWVGGVVAVLVFACSGLLDTKALESLPFLALVCAVLWAYVRERDVELGVFCALLVLVRGEGALLVVVLLGQAWIVRRRPPVKAAAVGALVALPWVVYSLATLGSVLPDTLEAKVAQGQSGFWGNGRLFLRGFADLAQPLHYRTWLLFVVPLAIAGLVRGLGDRRLRGVVAPLVAATILHALAYGVIFNVPDYYWYYSWELFTLAVLAALAVGWILEWMVVAAHGHWARVVVGFALVVLCVVFASTSVVYTRDTNQHYVAMGEWLASNTPSTATVAATEIGTIGWFSDRPIVDYLGLLDTESIAEVRRGDLTSWLARTEPDYWVAHSPLWPFEVAAQQPWFGLAYRPIYETAVLDGGYRLVVYEKVMSIASAEAAVGHG
jgi:hypothetical protein